MRKFLIPAILAGTMFAAAPASAQQGWRFQGPAYNQMRADIQQLDNQISRAEQRRRISSREAQGLRRQAIQLQRNLNAFSRNGIDRREHQQLTSQLRQIRQNLRLERGDYDNRRN